MASTTPVADATTTEVTELRHWIAGRPWDGPVERWGDVYDPASGQRCPSVRIQPPLDPLALLG